MKNFPLKLNQKTDIYHKYTYSIWSMCTFLTFPNLIIRTVM
nr:MAG TPA: hypothetical protein [Caudoviricetes sp.]